MTVTIGVIGSADPERNRDPLAVEVGSLIAGNGAVMVCGGLSGIMEAASFGVNQQDGVTIGILPGSDKRAANPFVTHCVPSGLGVARNVMIVRTADALIALPGGHGTMSEIALGLNVGKPVVDLGGWEIPGMIPVQTAEEAVLTALELGANLSE
ncbi:MAG: TIGR00725 family protein [bacterium]|nr:TIGR00725 family protein [bacterium]